MINKPKVPGKPGQAPTPLHVAIRESISGPRSSEAAVGLVAGFDPNTRATTKQQGDTVTLDLDSSTFNAAPWTEVTGGVSAIKPLQKTLSEINPTWSLEVLMDGIRLCEFAEGVICDE